MAEESISVQCHVRAWFKAALVIGAFLARFPGGEWLIRRHFERHMDFYVRHAVVIRFV